MDQTVGTGVSERKAEDIQFLGTFTARLDSKSRLSVPADFRRMLAAAGQGAEGAGFEGFVCARSLTRPILECGGAALFDHFMRQVSSIDEFDADREMLEEAFYAVSQRLFFDENGRVVLPAEMREHIGIEKEAVFVGRRGHFQIWHPDEHAKRVAALPGLVARHGETMRARSLPSMDKTGGKS